MIRTKLHIPPLQENHVFRSDLVDKLNSALTKKLTLISAPAGFGKTTLLCDWISRKKINAGWYSIDKRDNDPVIFLEYFIAAVQTINKEAGEGNLLLLQAPQRPALESVLGLLINDIDKIEQDFVIVLDDFHLIDSKEIFELIQFLLDHAPYQLHLVISTRSDPVIPLARYRSHNQLLELRASELNFRAQDISTFLNKRLRLGLSEDDILLLQKKTEGWIAGLQLSALSIQNHKDPSGFIREFAGDHRYIMDYLIEEVLNTQADDTREFLLLSSVLDQFSAPLCNYILNRDDSQHIIESLERNNMFLVPLDSEKNWYRYHHLFADLLQKRLVIKQIADVASLHMKSSQWYEKEDNLPMAIEHALQAKDNQRSMKLLDQCVSIFWEEGKHEMLLRFGELMPDEIIANHPNFSLYYSWALISSGKFQDAHGYLAVAEKQLTELIGKNDNTELEEKLLGKIFVAFAFLFSSSGDVEHIFKYCNKAKAKVSDQDTVWYSWAWYACGLGHMMADNLTESAEAFLKALIAGEKTDNLYLISTISNRFAFCELQRGHYKSAYGICKDLLKRIKEGGYSQMAENEWSFAGLYTTMGNIEYEWAEEGALRHVEIGYMLSAKGYDIISRVFSTIVYIRVLRYHGELKKIESLIKELDTVLKERAIFPYLQYTYLAVKLGTFIRFNQLDKASKFVEAYTLTALDQVNSDNKLLYTSYAWLLLAESKADEAETLLRSLHALAEKESRIERLVEIKVLLAVNHLILEDKKSALNELTESLALAEDEHLIISFINEGEHISALLETIYRQYPESKFRFSKKFLGQVIRAAEKKAKSQSTTALYSISKREIEVLRLMAENLSNQEIADQLFVSFNTIKAHAKNIHLKLDVDSRVKAVAKAKELGLLQ